MLVVPFIILFEISSFRHIILSDISCINLMNHIEEILGRAHACELGKEFEHGNAATMDLKNGDPLCDHNESIAITTNNVKSSLVNLRKGNCIKK